MMDIQKSIEFLQQKKVLPEKDLYQLISLLKDIFAEESTVQPVSAPVNICGDIHG